MARVNPYEYPENWRRHKDTDFYISDEGRVKQVKNGVEKFYEGTRDERAIRITINGERYNLPRLVWETFRGEIPEGYVIVHKNECITMNDLFNLEIKPKSEVYANAAKKRGKKVRDKKTGKIYNGLNDCARTLHHGINTVREDCEGRRKRFEFVERDIEK